MGLYVKAGLTDTTAALMVIVGAFWDGRKVVPSRPDSMTVCAATI